MVIKSFKDLRTRARAKGPRTVVAVGAEQATFLRALDTARKEGMAEGILIGDEAQIRALAAQEHVDLGGVQVIDEADPAFAAHKSMMLIAEGKAHAAMKGKVDTATFLRAALDKQVGLH